MPKVSVVITTYNRAHFLSDAIDSVLNQTFKGVQIIVIDDGSTDNTRQILGRYGDRIEYVYQQNAGRAQARNIGIKAAQGDYIAFLDDDDIWLPEKLEKQIIFLEAHQDIGLVHTFTEVINEQGFLLEEETRQRLKSYRKSMKIGYTYEGMSRYCTMFISSVILRSRCLDEMEFFDSTTETFEDWDFYLRFSLKYRIGIIPQALVRFRVHKVHSTLDEFTHGRITTAMKHLARLDSGGNFCSPNRVRYNLYLHLANAYYIDAQLIMFRFFARKAIRLNPLILFHSRLGLHLLSSIVPTNIIGWIRQLKNPATKISVYPERIIPAETPSGPLSSHLKRYDFARQFCQAKVILDAACGVGYGSNYLAQVAQEVIGVDISQEAITYAQEHYQRENIQFKVSDVTNLEFPDEYFDLVCTFETLEHLAKPEKFIDCVRRLLKPEGEFIFSVPHVKNTRYAPSNPYHYIEFSQKDLETILKKYFKSVEIFGQRRKQSNLHYYLQIIDIFHLRARLPNFARRKICHALVTHSWDEVNLEDIFITKEKISHSSELIGICRIPIKEDL
jgi:glycosyltransferase involved in cell wall biosynthesis/ubiquinone/menaquinone biosynthesis C-methylase UbiE